jgi:hypothetical protein
LPNACYGTNITDAYRQAGVYTGCIPQGREALGPASGAAKQVEGHSTATAAVMLVVLANLTAVKVLGLDVPPTLLARADEVIE